MIWFTLIEHFSNVMYVWKPWFWQDFTAFHADQYYGGVNMTIGASFGEAGGSPRQSDIHWHQLLLPAEWIPMAWSISISSMIHDIHSDISQTIIRYVLFGWITPHGVHILGWDSRRLSRCNPGTSPGIWTSRQQRTAGSPEIMWSLVWSYDTLLLCTLYYSMQYTYVYIYIYVYVYIYNIYIYILWNISKWSSWSFMHLICGTTPRTDSILYIYMCEHTV